MAITWTNIEAGGSRAVYYSTPTVDTFQKLLADGVPLGNAAGWVLSIWADPGCLLSGTGTAQCWIYDPMWIPPPSATPYSPSVGPIGAWARATDFDVTVPASHAQQGFMSQGSSPGLGLPLVVKKGTRVAYAPSSILLTGGGGVTFIISICADRPGH